ncbi:MAG: restriction endonuclease subunit S [Oscillospiraceae bacterium]|nr:restriction endonuclease subunit S [Oscillospiraceae bacterium]
MSYPVCQINSICSLVTSGGTPLTKNLSYYNPPEIPWLKTAEVNYCRIYDTEKYISKEGLNNSSAKLIPENSVIVAMYGQGDTAGRVAINKIPLATNQACCNLVIDEEKADYQFVYYALSTLYDKLVSLKNGGAQPNLNAGIIKALEIPCPPLETQRRIASIISAYDDLIENNQKQIKLLEEAAQRLYKEWFVDLRFSNYENTPVVDGVPEGWKKKTVLECLELHIGGGWGKETETGKNVIPGRVIRGTDINDIKSGNFKEVPIRFHTENDIKKRSLKENDIVFELSNGNINNIGRSLFIDNLILKNCGENTICASFCKLFRPLDRTHALTLYFEIQDMQLSGRMLPYKKQGSNGINNFAFEDFLKHELLVPQNLKMLLPFENIMKKICNIQSQFALLTEVRDRLLPKLMSGELEV